jgi:hypothetical protein
MRKASIVAFSVLVSTVSALAQAPGTPSPGWALAMPRGPDARVKITDEYAKLVARDVYFWAWPMVNMYNRRLAFKDGGISSWPVLRQPPPSIGLQC